HHLESDLPKRTDHHRFGGHDGRLAARRRSPLQLQRHPRTHKKIIPEILGTRTHPHSTGWPHVAEACPSLRNKGFRGLHIPESIASRGGGSRFLGRSRTR